MTRTRGSTSRYFPRVSYSSDSCGPRAVCRTLVSELGVCASDHLPPTPRTPIPTAHLQSVSTHMVSFSVSWAFWLVGF